MQKDRREFVAISELACFLVAWMLCIAAVVNDTRGRSVSSPANEIASTSSFSEEYRDLFD